MRILFGALGLALLAGLAGCATSVTPLSQATPVPVDELFAHQSKPQEPSGKLTVVRDSGVRGSGCDVVVYINGKKSAKVGPGQRASFFLPVGQPDVGIGLTDSGICAGMAVRSIAGNVREGKESLYRISVDMSGAYIGPYLEYN